MPALPPVGVWLMSLYSLDRFDGSGSRLGVPPASLQHRLMPVALLVCLVFATLSGPPAYAASIRDAPYRGKSRTFFGTEDPAVPASLKTPAQPSAGHPPVVV